MFFVSSNYPFKIEKSYGYKLEFTFWQAKYKRASLMVTYYTKRNRHNERKKLKVFQKEMVYIRETYPEEFI